MLISCQRGNLKGVGSVQFVAHSIEFRLSSFTANALYPWNHPIKLPRFSLIFYFTYLIFVARVLSQGLM